MVGSMVWGLKESGDLGLGFSLLRTLYGPGGPDGTTWKVLCFCVQEISKLGVCKAVSHIQRADGWWSSAYLNLSSEQPDLAVNVHVCGRELGPLKILSNSDDSMILWFKEAGGVQSGPVIIWCILAFPLGFLSHTDQPPTLSLNLSDFSAVILTPSISLLNAV